MGPGHYRVAVHRYRVPQPCRRHCIGGGQPGRLAPCACNGILGEDIDRARFRMVSGGGEVGPDGDGVAVQIYRTSEEGVRLRVGRGQSGLLAPHVIGLGEYVDRAGVYLSKAVAVQGVVSPGSNQHGVSVHRDGPPEPVARIFSVEIGHLGPRAGQGVPGEYVG